MQVLSFIFAVIFLLHDQASALSALTNGQHIYACAEDELTLPFDLILSQGQLLKDVQWFFNGNSEEVIAILSHNHFLAMPSYANRVSRAGHVGIVLDHVTDADRGNYSVEVTVQNANGSIFSVVESVYVHLSDGLPTLDGQLHATALPTPVFDASRQQWSLVLTCGHFVYLGLPPFTVLWNDPEGNRLANSEYANGEFRVHLTSPIKGGAYSCQIPHNAASNACLNGSLITFTDVDEMTSRMTLIEANQNYLMTQLRKENEELKAALANSVHDRTSFRAKLASPIPAGMVVEGQRLPFVKVISNHSDAYDASSGIFHAPLDGWYFFALSTRCTLGYADAQVLTNTGEWVCRVNSHVKEDAGSCQGAVYLTRGQRVWVEAYNDVTCYNDDTSVFSGFMISVDT